MRICILTLPLGANYGGILQAYALQKVLSDMGNECTTLRFLPAAPTWVPSGFSKRLLTLRRFFSKYVKGNRTITFCDPDRQTRFAYKELERFISERIHCLKVDAPLTARSLPAFDAYVVGSDQVWRPMYSPCLPNFYLDFLPDGPARRIAYAASFGVDRWEADEATTARIRPLAQKFDAISVREESAIALCRKYLDVPAQLVPDPTLLLTDADYLRLCRTERQETEPYIAAYILDKNDDVRRFLDRVSQEWKLPVRFVGQTDWIKGADSLESWILGIAEASFVLTDSFHGTVLSILFKRNFVSVVNKERGASRFFSLLDSVGLRDRLVGRDQLEGYVPARGAADFGKVEEALERMRQEGRAFLHTLQ